MKKVIGIFIVTLLMMTAIPAVGFINEINEELRFLSKSNSNLNILDYENNIYSEKFLDEEWNKTYGGSESEDLLYYVEETDDGGYIALGQIEEIGGSFYAWLLKLDSEGNEQWSVMDLQRDDYIMPSFMEKTNDGGYIICGYLYSEEVEFNYKGFLWKVDETGSTEWIKEYIENLWYVLETEDGYICAGFETVESGNVDILICKMDLSGSIQWKKLFDYEGQNDYGYSLCKTNDGGYLIGGFATTNNKAGEFWMIKTDSSGNKEWDQIHGGSKNDFSHARNSYQTIDGGYLMIGITNSFGAGRNDIMLVKTNENGEMQWNKTFGGQNEERCWGMGTTHEGGYIICAVKNYGSNFEPKGDMWIIKIDGNGVVEISQTFGGSREDRGYYISQTSDGGYIIAGKAESFGDGPFYGWLVKLSSFNNNRPNKPEKPTGPSRGEPNTEYTFSTNTVTDPDGDTLGYMWDWGDGNYSDLLDTTEASYTWSYEDNFEVRVMAVDEHGGESDWSDPLPFSTPKNKITINTILERLLSRLPIFKFLI